MRQLVGAVLLLVVVSVPAQAQMVSGRDDPQAAASAQPSAHTGASAGDEIERLTHDTQLAVYRDRFTGRATVRPVNARDLPPNLPGLGLLNTIYVQPGCLRAQQKTTCYLKLDAWLDEWAFFTGAVDFLADGKPLHLADPDTPRRDVKSSGGVEETILLLLDEDALAALAGARYWSNLNWYTEGA